MKVLYFLTPFLIILDLVLGNYSILIFGGHIPAKFVRNFYGVGLPYFCIGNLLFKKMDFILGIKNITLKSGVCCIIFSLTTALEKQLLISLSAVATRDHAASILPLAISLFVFFVALYKNRTPSSIEERIAFIGNRFSTSIYILHPIFIRYLMYITRGFGFYEPYRYVSNICVFALTILVIAIHYKYTKTSSQK